MIDICPECTSALRGRQGTCQYCGERQFPRTQNKYVHPVENERVESMRRFDPNPLRRYPDGRTNLVKELPR